ncbi:hypothetical protein [Actinomadura flavalba]|uniref:hypothetical protein n=1 Tax=Actinomadura flavalba TaxID=1120938 RepID=UPI0003656E4D|nr:hypothetical protein [Actinomadura flavalba]
MTLHAAPATPAVAPLTAARATGAALAAGATAWAATLLAAGDRVKEVLPAEIAGSMAFVLSVLALVLLLRAVRATGDRAGRVLLTVETALLTAAALWCVTALAYGDDGPSWTLPLDLCWPLSMLGMLVVGITAVRKGRLRGGARWHLLAASLWLPVTLPGQALLGDAGGTYLGAGWLVLTYATFGVRLAVAPAAVLPRA